MMALDPRHQGKPSCFDGTQEGSYDEWRFHLVANLTAVDPRFGNVADDLARRTTPYLLKMALLRRIMHSKLNCAGSDAEFINKLSEWQQVVREYERISGSELDQTVKTATLMEEAPPQMQEHLRLRSEEIGTDYKKVIQAIEGYLRSKKTWNTGPDDMEVDAVV